MSIHEDLELLDQTETDLGDIADAVEESTGIDRRDFMFYSLVDRRGDHIRIRLARARLRRQRPAGQAPQAPASAAARQRRAGVVDVPAISRRHRRADGEAGPRARRRRVPARDVHRRSQWTGAVPTSPDEIAFLPAHRLSALIKARKITSTQLTQIYLDRIKRLDPTLLCAVTIMEEQALAEAAKADAEIKAGKYRGPLHGIPYGVKDLFSTKGVRTTWGSKDFENRIIDEDAEVVVRLRDAGAVLMAKLATGLFAQGDQWYRGRTNNPWDIRRGSSGSSAGPSSATAAGCVAFGIGTETSGSIVSPARECGLSALRPTFGRVSRYGGMVLAWSQDRVGPICRTIEDCAMVFNAIHGVDPKDPSTVMTPFHFDREHQARVAAHRRRRRPRRRSSSTSCASSARAEADRPRGRSCRAAARSASSRRRRSTRTCR